VSDKKLGEFITIALAKGAKKDRIFRKDMTDAEWERVKKNAADSGHLVLDNGMPGGDAPVDLEVNKKVNPESPPSTSGIGVFPDRQNETPDEEPQSESAVYNPEQSKSNSDKRELKKLVKTIKEVVSGPEKPTGPGYTEPDFEADPRAVRQQEEARKSENSGESYKVVDGEKVPVKRWFPEGSKAQPGGGVKIPVETGPDGRPRTPVVDPEMAPLPEPSLLEKVTAPFDAAGKALQSGVHAVIDPISRVLTPTPSAEPQLADPTDEPPTQTVASPPAVAGGEPAPGAGTPPLAPGVSSSASVGVKSTKPGSGAGSETPASPFDADRKAAEAAYQHELDAISMKADAEGKRNKAESQILQDKLDFVAKNEKQRLDAVNTFDETMRRGEESMAAIADERRALMNTKVDPDAYFTKGGTGRLVLAAISGALHGWTGQGPQFLNRLDNLMQQEVKNQQDELARKASTLDSISADKRNALEMAKTRGLSQLQSIAASKVSFLDDVQTQLAKAATDNPLIAAQAQMLAAQVEQKKAALGLEFSKATQADAHQKVQDRIAMMRAQTERMELNAKMGIGGGKGKSLWQEMKPQQQKDIQGLLAVGRQIGDMSKQWKDQAGDPLAAIKQHLGLGMEATDASKWKNSSSKFHAQTIGTVLEKGKLTDADFPKYLDSFIPSAGNTKEAAMNRINNLVKYAVTQYVSEISSLDAALVRSIGLPTPAEYQSMLVRDINDSGGGGAIPGEQPYGAR
jgi:hypothetical protein